MERSLGRRCIQNHLTQLDDLGIPNVEGRSVPANRCEFASRWMSYFHGFAQIDNFEGAILHQRHWKECEMDHKPPNKKTPEGGRQTHRLSARVY
jgi:hypothetical protein